jgi:3',5'-cyclic AMP phosphodiesterase CpdA
VTQFETDADGVNLEKPSRFIVHFSDTHLVADDDLLYGKVDSKANVAKALEQLEAAEFRPDAIVLTGDLADTGLDEAYRRLRTQLEASAERLDTEIIWVMGNHDKRDRFRANLLDEEPSDTPVDRVHWLGGLRIVVLDSTVPGFHYGELTDEQLEWLRAELTTSAPEGTLLAMHHPPMPDPVYAAAGIELRHYSRLAEVIEGTDVRSILAGHLHYSTHTTFAGIPVSVASATCYTNAVTEAPGAQRGVNGAQSLNLVHLYRDQVVHTIMPVASYDTLYEIDGQLLRLFNSLSIEKQNEVLKLSNEERLALASRMLAQESSDRS